MNKGLQAFLNKMDPKMYDLMIEIHKRSTIRCYLNVIEFIEDDGLEKTLETIREIADEHDSKDNLQMFVDKMDDTLFEEE